MVDNTAFNWAEFHYFHRIRKFPIITATFTLRWRHNGAIASQITSVTIVYSTVYSDADQRKHQSSASLAFVWGIHRRPVNSPHKLQVTRKMFSFHDVILSIANEPNTAVGYLRIGIVCNVGIDTNIEVIVVSFKTWEAHHSPRAKPERAVVSFPGR